MSALAFPLTAALFVYFLAVPALSVVSAALLRMLRARATRGEEVGDWVGWALLVTPVLLPTAWFVAEVAHQLDGHHGIVLCAVPHGLAAICVDLLLVALFVVTPLVARALWQGRADGGSPAAQRAETLHGVRVYRGHAVPQLACTRGLLRPRIELDDCLGELSREELRGVLFHERAHAQGRDPLRKWVASLCLAVNPAESLLRPEFTRWLLGREIACDVQAVRAGADRFALAQALVRVARLNPAAAGHTCGIAEMDTLDLRVRLLCDDDFRPAANVARSLTGIALVAATVGLVMPHVGESSFLDWLHHAAEAGWLLAVAGVV